MAHAVTKSVTKKAVKVFVANYPHGQVLYVHNKVTNYECIAIGFLTNDGKRYHQELMWMCRAGPNQYYKALVKLYRYLYRNRITTKSLQFLASGNKKHRHGGRVIRKALDSELRAAA